MPHIWSPWTKHVLLAADNIVITALPDLASLRNTKNIIDIVRASRSNDVAPFIVLNQVGMPKRPEIPVKDFAAAIGIEPAMVIPFNPALFGTASNNGQMIGEIEPKGKMAEGFRVLSSRICGRDVQASRPRSSSRFSFLGKK
jgi:pilus assembly protein CpaE